MKFISYPSDPLSALLAAPSSSLEDLESGKLLGTKILKLSCGLQRFPVEILDLAPTLEVLDLSGNELSELPDDFCRLSKLRIFFASKNRFRKLPAVLGRCAALSLIGFRANQIEEVPPSSLPPSLRWLTLTENQIRSLPKEIGSLSRLRKCLLAGNLLESLPDTMRGCLNLEPLRISANKFSTLPKWLTELPRLSWLAFAGNPFCDEQRVDDELPSIPRGELVVGARLGQGASGDTFEAEWKSATGIRRVAIKLFKDAVTSDGLPNDEAKACIASNGHPNLVKLLGRTVASTNPQLAFVFERIPAEFTPLGMPPDFQSCTRDTYPPERTLGLGTLIAIARGVSSAARHLHERGVMHGDLYAHNILVAKAGQSFLTDFGAACRYPVRKIEGPDDFQRIEVRAFGCLLGELIALCAALNSEPQTGALEILRKLERGCLSERISERPNFLEIFQELDGVLR